MLMKKHKRKEAFSKLLLGCNRSPNKTWSRINTDINFAKKKKKMASISWFCLPNSAKSKVFISCQFQNKTFS